LGLPLSVAVDASGNLFIAETSGAYGDGEIRRVSASAPTPLPTTQITLVANAFGDTPVIAPNTWVEIKGTNLALPGDTRIWQGADFMNNQLPTQLDGVSVTVNGKNAFLYYISPTQVNVLTPPDALPSSTQVQLTNNGVKSNVAVVQAQPQSLSFFEFVSSGGLHYVYGRRQSDNSLIGPTSLFAGLSTPVKPGDPIYVAATGFGTTDVPIVSGALTQSGNLPQPFPVVKIGGIQASVSFAGLVAVGTYQINLVVPPNLPDGDLPLTATYNGLSTQPNLLITIQQAPANTGLQIQSLTLSPNSVASGGTVAGSVVLSLAAPSGGAVVALSSSSSAASVPATVTIPAGATSATFTLSAGTVSSSQTATITAS
jgi:uncharacterized protein (TIGR03437 family)